MLTDTKLRNLKPGPRAYKVVDRDGLYAMVLASGVVSFRFNYRINGRQETLVLGRYGRDGLTLAEAREKLDAARKLVASGLSPMQHKRRQKQRLAGEESFGEWAERWLTNYRMAESTRDMRRSVYERDLERPFGKLLLHEITHEELRALCDKIVARGAPATAVHAREIVMLVFRYAGQRGHEHPNPADKVPPCAIATFQPRDRALSSTEIPWLYEFLEQVQSAPTLRLAVKLLLLTLVRKSELTDATWDEFDFTNGVWTIPAERMKRRNPHNVYLSRQAIDMFIALKTCAAGSRYVLPSRYDADLTPEKLLYVLRQQPELANHIGQVAYDEGHQFDSGWLYARPGAADIVYGVGADRRQPPPGPEVRSRSRFAADAGGRSTTAWSSADQLYQ